MPTVMNPEVLKEWTEALESGEFKQGANRLSKPETNEWCCLGVLCELYRRKFPDNASWTQFGFFSLIKPHTGSSYGLPKPVLEWAQFHVTSINWSFQSEFQLVIDGESADPATQNDGCEERTDGEGRHYPAVKRKTFAQIAQAIREKYSLEVPAS